MLTLVNLKLLLPTTNSKFSHLDTQWAYLTGIRVRTFKSVNLFLTQHPLRQDFVQKKHDYIQTQVGNPEGADKPNKKVYNA